MIDESDGDFVLLSSSGAGFVLGLILVTIAIGLYCVAAKNSDECSRRECPAGQKAKVVAHECLCVAPAPAPSGGR